MNTPHEAFDESDKADRVAIRDLLENWVIWRDAGDWDRFATVWHPKGRMAATWFEAPAPEFIARSRKAFEAGMVGHHFLGGSSIEVRGDRAMSQTKMQLLQRAPLDGVYVDAICQGRFVDAFERHDGRWGMVLRQPVYELDRLTPVEPGVAVHLDRALLETFPEGYRHLGYLQEKLGFTVRRDLPGTRGPEIADLMARMTRWLAGEGDIP